MASKRKPQLNISDKVSCHKRKKVETINKGELARPDGFIATIEVIGKKWALGTATHLGEEIAFTGKAPKNKQRFLHKGIVISSPSLRLGLGRL